MVKNKKGWIRVVEAVMAILLLMALLFIFFNNNQDSDEKVRKAMERKESELLNQVEMNQSLRDSILSASVLPVTSNLDLFPEVLRNYSREELLKENCVLQLCPPEDSCSLDLNTMEEFDGAIYLKSIIIHSNQTVHSPKRLSMACSNDGLLSDYFPACDDGRMNGEEDGIDCGGLVCSACLYCISEITGTEEGEVTFDCGKLGENPCITSKFCDWNDPVCDKKTCGDFLIGDCNHGHGCVAADKIG